MNLWQQNYDPAGNIWLSSLIASLPILFFFFALIKLKLKGYVAATWTVVIALSVALLFYKMPVDHALASVIYGFFYGLWPIAWIIIAAVFVYKISVKTGQFDIIRSSILSITPDQRLQMLIVGFSFGAFLEGAAGFGAPVAITAALLVGLGFNPLYAAGLCLIVNTAPVAFGAMGIPILVAGQVTGLDSFEIGQMVGRQLPFLTIIVLFWIMAIMDGWRGIKETWPAVMVAGGSFAIAQYLSSNFLGPELPDIISSLVSLVCLTLFLKRWQPVRIFRFGDMGASQVDMNLARTHYTPGQVIRAWTPFLFLTATVTLWSVPPFKALFAPGGAMCDPVRRAAFHRLAAHEAKRCDFHLWQHAERAGVADLLHRHGAGVRLYFQLFRSILNAGAGAGAHRPCIYLLLAVPRLAGGIPDRFRYLV